MTFYACTFSGNKGKAARVFYIENDLAKEFFVIDSTFTSREVYGESYMLTKIMQPFENRMMTFSQPSLIKVNNNQIGLIVILNCTAKDTHFAEVGAFA